MSTPPPGLAPPSRWPRIVRSSLGIGVVLVVPAVAAWVFGQPFIFPSLGPSAYSLVVMPRQHYRWEHVLGGHAIGLACGYASYHLLAAHGALVELHPPPLSLDALRLIAAGLLALVLTAALMRLLRVAHPPACATTLLVGFGLLPTARDALFIASAVGVMIASYQLLLHSR